MSVTAKFNKYAESYDQSRRKLIPCYSDFYKTIIKIIPFASSAPFSVADLGAGTGLLSKQIIEAYPQSKITVVDISDEMLNVAKSRLSAYSNIEYQLIDYSKAFPSGNFDLIVSSLSIHHLSDKNKKLLFRCIKESLNPNGIFINADQVLGESEEIENLYHSTWLSEVKKNGITEQELSEALDRMTEDKMSTLSNQIKWLKESGFSTVNCWYQNLRFAVYSGINKSN